MKLKKLFTFAVMAASVAMFASAAPFSGYKLMLNPGHGGHDSDDRPTALPLNTTMFYESDGNLTRALYMRDLYALYGGSYSITRTHNTTADDLNLTYIATLSNNYAGYFISEHTNGGNASANYTSAFYKGSNSTNAVAGSKQMGQAIVDQHHKVELTNTTYSTPRSLADYDMWGWHYGILRTNTRPATLVETWFHDYRPEALRLKSFHYNRFLGWQIVRGFLTYPVNGSGMKGAIAGDCRDLSQSCGYTNYATRGRDSYLALNGVKVTLKNSSGAIVSVKTWSAKSGDDASYYPSTQANPQTTDNFNNGVFFFDELTAGTYTVEVSKTGYANQSKTVTVSNDNITKCCFDMKQGTSTGISPSVTMWEASANVGATATKSVTVTGTGLSANITLAITGTNANQFSLSTTSLAASGGSFTITYKPTAAGSHSANVTLTSGSQKETIAITGTAKNPPLTFTQGWNYSETSGKAAPWAADFTHMRNMDYANGKLYVVDPGRAIYIIHAQKGTKIGELSMSGVTGGALSIVDVKCIDGKIIGCNVATSDEGKNNFKIYCWDSDAATPRVILNTTNFGGKARIGDCIDLRGNLTTGSFSFAAGSTSEDNVVLTYAITNGVVATSPTSLALKDETGENGIKLGLSPRIVPEQNNQFWGIGQNYLPTLFMSDGKTRATVNSDVLADIAGNCITAFTYKGTSYGLISDYQAGSTQAERLKGGRAVLVDATNGWAKAEKIGEYPSAGLGQTRNTSLSTSLCTHVDGDKGVEMWVLVHNQGIAYFKAGSPTAIEPQDPSAPSITANPAAVNISVVEGQSGQATVNFTTANVTSNISLALSGSNANLFSIDKTSLSSAGGSVTITYSPTATGNHSAILTATSGTATSTVSIAGQCGSYQEPIDESKFEFKKINEGTSNIVARADGRFSTGYGDYVYIPDKANGQIVRYDKTGAKSVYATLEGVGTAISSDDAGNIIVDKGFSGVGSSTNWVIIEPNGTQTAVTFEGFTAARLDHVGRTVGDVTSAQGGYLYLTPNGQNAVIAVKIANKAFVSATASPATDLTFDATAVAQPMYKTVAEVEAASNKGATAYFRVRGSKNVWSWNGTTATSLGSATGATTSDGFDVFELNGKKYTVEPAGSNYSDAFVIRRLTDNEIVVTKNLNLITETNPSFQSFTARVSEDGRYVIIYQNLAGKLVAQYRYGMPESSAPVQQVAAPTFTPAAGTYTAAQNVTIACATSGADIYYTLDGSNPS
ncbi:MAG: N-acetylmuramoyl-L-alanine amidase, partial [Muribaculaceae bacterium]|nr:N-acetylmuramoyl-L-alanine amidase [Muribaculaceae bacterium]